MMPSRRYSILLLLVVAMLVRPEAPMDTRFIGGSMQGAMEALALTAAEQQSISARAFDDGYRHWASTKLQSTEDPLALVGLQAAHEETPVIAGLVGIAAITGLRDLAAVCLYLLSDHAEHSGDWEMCDLTLQAIPFVDPHFVDAYVIRAYFFRKSDPARAERILLRGVKWNSEDWELWHDLAWLHLRPKTERPPSPEMAVRYLRAAVAVRHPYKVRRLLAYVLAHLGHWDEAAEVVETMLTIPSLSAHDRRLAEQSRQEIHRRYDRLTERFAAMAAQQNGQSEPHEHHHFHHHTHGHCETCNH